MPYSTQSAASKRTANTSTGNTQFFTNQNPDPSVKPGTPKAVATTGSIITTVGPANNSIWSLQTSRHAAGIPVVPAACYPAGNKVTGGAKMGITKVLSYADTQNPSVTKNYTFVNQSVKIKAADGGWVYYRGYYIPKVVKPVVKPNVDNKVIPAKPSSTHEYRWNLPPHKWSLPLLASTDPNFMPDGYQRPASQDRYRRGRLWWRANDPNLSLTGDGTTATALGSADAHKYGFQFLWNPETFSTAVAVNMDATPSQADRFIGGPGYFPATEVFSITIRLDRTNDFACAAANFDRPTWTAPPTLLTRASGLSADIIAAANASSASNAFGKAQNFVDKSKVSQFIKYYRVNGSFAQNETDASIQEKLIDLYQRGTLADLEFLLRAINGSGPGSSKNGKPVTWTNGRGISTADIGFLIPTVLNIDIGPLSYQGYVTSMNVVHGAFTQDMIPIRSDITLSFNLLATVGLTAPALSSGT